MCGADQINPLGIAEGPLNTAIDLSASTTTVLRCEGTDESPTSRISWTEYATTSSGAPISDNDLVCFAHTFPCTLVLKYGMEIYGYVVNLVV